jgi:hypothetical protein
MADWGFPIEGQVVLRQPGLGPGLYRFDFLTNLYRHLYRFVNRSKKSVQAHKICTDFPVQIAE